MAVVKYGSFGRFILWILLLIGAFLCVFPFFWMAVGTTLNPNDVVRGVIMPGGEFSLNFAKAVKNNNLLLYFFNSMKIALLTVLFGVSVNAFAAFGFEKYRSKAREWVFAVLLLALIIPQIALVLPQFRLISFFKLLDTHAAIILPGLMSVFIIFFMRQNFRMFPNEIMEAAGWTARARHDFHRHRVPLDEGELRLGGNLHVHRAVEQLPVAAHDHPGEPEKDAPDCHLVDDARLHDRVRRPDGRRVPVGSSGPRTFLAMQRQFVAGLLGSVK